MSKKSSRIIIALLAVVILCICVAGPLLIDTGSGSGNARAQDVSDEIIRSAVECENAARKKLLNPSTAKFAKYKQGEEVFKVRNRPDGWYLVTSHVEATNAYGATLRNYYSCVVVNEQTFWRIEEFKFVLK